MHEYVLLEQLCTLICAPFETYNNMAGSSHVHHKNVKEYHFKLNRKAYHIIEKVDLQKDLEVTFASPLFQ